MGWIEALNCPATHPVQPWVSVDVPTGTTLRWRFWVPGSFDLNSTTFTSLVKKSPLPTSTITPTPTPVVTPRPAPVVTPTPAVSPTPAPVVTPTPAVSPNASTCSSENFIGKTSIQRVKDSEVKVNAVIRACSYEIYLISNGARVNGAGISNIRTSTDFVVEARFFAVTCENSYVARIGVWTKLDGQGVFRLFPVPGQVFPSCTSAPAATPTPAPKPPSSKVSIFRGQRPKRGPGPGAKLPQWSSRIKPEAETVPGSYSEMEDRAQEIFDKAKEVSDKIIIPPHIAPFRPIFGGRDWDKAALARGKAILEKREADKKVDEAKDLLARVRAIPILKDTLEEKEKLLNKKKGDLKKKSGNDSLRKDILRLKGETLQLHGDILQTEKNLNSFGK